MMTIARSPHYHFYSVFLVEEDTFDDIRSRMEKQDMLRKHLMTDDDGEEIIVFGTTAFKKEPSQF